MVATSSIIHSELERTTISYLAVAEEHARRPTEAAYPPRLSHMTNVRVAVQHGARNARHNREYDVEDVVVVRMGNRTGMSDEEEAICVHVVTG